MGMPGNDCMLSQAIEADTSLWDALSRYHPIWIILALLVLTSPFIIREWRKASNERLKILLKDERQRMKLNNALKRHKAKGKGKK